MSKHYKTVTSKSELELIKEALGYALTRLNILEEKLDEDDRSVAAWLKRDGC